MEGKVCARYSLVNGLRGFFLFYVFPSHLAPVSLSPPPLPVCAQVLPGVAALSEI